VFNDLFLLNIITIHLIIRLSILLLWQYWFDLVCLMCSGSDGMCDSFSQNIVNFIDYFAVTIPMVIS
jgi:hypothetical protein